MPVLVDYLSNGSPLLFGKYLELRQVVGAWLQYIPNTFPHYTRHTVEHSDKIIAALSNLLFHEADLSRPVLRLSAAEAYILLAAALLHDSGMVCSDSEKVRILSSDQWRDWIAEGDREKRVADIGQLRSATAGVDPVVCSFLADIQLRFLIAEFLRAKHHLRSGEFLQCHQALLGRFGLDDPALIRTIADVCVAHGLSHSDLNDEVRFPLERDIRDDKVNVRLMALLLRLGDLLDMDCDRACPLLLSAASPLPSTSLAHWSQYKRIVHRNTSPDVIEIHAECQSQSEHRVLLDWCNWIRDEVEAIPRLLPKLRRHGGWVPPKVSIGSQGSIRITPSASARYIPSEWRIELDVPSVFERLIKDAYQNRLAFIRELLQNAIDATRCRMYEDFQRMGGAWPKNPLELPEEFRDRYPIEVIAGTELVRNELSGQQDEFGTLEIADNGIGMSVGVIERYFLQVGRSYYQAPEFRRKYGFPSIGRHGVGFLSVFSASELVVVNTRSVSDGQAVESNMLTFTGPRSYFLREPGTRTEAGTSIRIRLKENLPFSELVGVIQRVCRRVEMPIVVRDASKTIQIDAESRGKFEAQVSSVIDEKSRFEVVSHSVSTPNLNGEVYVFQVSSERGVSWSQWSWAHYDYLKSHPSARLPRMPATSICVNGLDYSESEDFPPFRDGPVALRVDYRGPNRETQLDRFTGELPWRRDLAREYPEIAEIMRGLLDAHLASRVDSDLPVWKYKQRLMEWFKAPDYWRVAPETVACWQSRTHAVVSAAEVQAEGTLFVAQSAYYTDIWESHSPKMLRAIIDDETRVASAGSGMNVERHVLMDCNEEYVGQLFRNRRIDAADVIENVVRCRWVSSIDDAGSRDLQQVRFSYCAIPTSSQVGYVVFGGGRRAEKHLLLNTEHEWTQWFVRAMNASKDALSGVRSDAIYRVAEIVDDIIRYRAIWKFKEFEEFLRRWSGVSEMPANMSPPRLTPDELITPFPTSGGRSGVGDTG